MHEDMFGYQNRQEASTWHLISRSQRCCQTSCNTQDSPPQHYRTQNADTATVTVI